MHKFKMSERNTNHDLCCLSFADTYKIDTALAGLFKEEPGANFTIDRVFILWLDTGSHVHLVQSVYMHAEVRLSYLYVFSELLVVVPACFHTIIFTFASYLSFLVIYCCGFNFYFFAKQAESKIFSQHKSIQFDQVN